MKIKKIIFILCGIFLLCGCQKSQNNTADNQYKKEYETRIDNGVTTYIFDGKEYSHLLTLTGRSKNAANDTCYTVLSNDETLDFKKADERFWSSQYSGEETFCIIGISAAGN